MESNVSTFQQRQQTLTDALSTRILVLDGAMVQARNLHAADFGGAALEGCNEYLVKSRPEVIDDIHRAYLRAGSDIPLRHAPSGRLPPVHNKIQVTDNKDSLGARPEPRNFWPLCYALRVRGIRALPVGWCAAALFFLGGSLNLEGQATVASRQPAGSPR